MHNALSNICEIFSNVLASGGYTNNRVGTKPNPRVHYVEVYLNNGNAKITIEILFSIDSGFYKLYARQHVKTGKVWNLLPSKSINRILPEYSCTDAFLTNMMDLFQTSLASM